MDYLIGDVQGCCDALDALLAKIDFSPSRDRIFVLGDLVNRGPRSLDTLRTPAVDELGWRPAREPLGTNAMTPLAHRPVPRKRPANRSLVRSV